MFNYEVNLWIMQCFCHYNQDREANYQGIIPKAVCLYLYHIPLFINLRHFILTDMYFSLRFICLAKTINFRLGEGCTNVACLFFSLENINTTDRNKETCMLKSCEWSKPSTKKARVRHG